MAANLRIAALITAFVLFYAVVYSSLIASSYTAKVLIACLCLATIGFVVGFRPQPASRSARIVHSYNVIFFICATLVVPVGELTGIFNRSADERYALMLKAPYILTYLLLVIAIAGTHFLAVALFRRPHPSEDVLPSAEDTEEPAEPSPADRRRTRRLMLLAFLALLPGIVCAGFFPGYSMKLMIVAMLSSTAAISAFVGWRWPQPDSPMRWLFPTVGVVGPISGFLGYYGGSKIQDTAHLLAALRFSAILAATMWIPALAIRALRRRD